MAAYITIYHRYAVGWVGRLLVCRAAAAAAAEMSLICVT